MEKPINLEKVFEMIPNVVSLTYVDYNDNLDNYYKEIQQCIAENSLDKLYEVVDEAFSEQENDNVQRILKDIRKQIMVDFEVTKAQAKAFIEIYEDTLKDKIYERNDSDTIRDIIRNTCKIVCFYDTGYEVEPDSWNWKQKQINAEVQRIKKVLKIRGNNDYNSRIEMMVRQASYGGQLVVYFRIDFEKLINEKNEVNTICFVNPVIAIIDTDGGSGDDCWIEKHSFNLPYNSKNVFIDKLIKYNYTYSVCGMFETWCEATQVSFKKTNIKTKLADSSTNVYLDKEAAYNKTFKNGSCTTGDMDSGRHRNVTYINNYPCGNKCLDCGTFWID